MFGEGMPDVSLDDLLPRIKETHWQWQASAWKEVVRQMQFTAIVADRQKVPTEKTLYVDPSGRKAWAKWIRSNPVRLGFEIAKHDTSPDLSETEYEELFSRVDRQFKRVQKAISDRWGACAFIGRHGDVGFPDDEAADRLALWNSEGYRLLLEVTHGGRETPIALLLYIAAPAR